MNYIKKKYFQTGVLHEQMIRTKQNVVRCFVVMLLLALSFSAYSQSAKQYNQRLNNLYSFSIPFITAEELALKLQRRQDVYILDCREPNEYKISHIAKAINVGYEKFSIHNLKKIPRNAEIVVYCSLGVRSEKIAKQLKNNGFAKVYNLYGGIFEWVHKGYLIVNKRNKVTGNVHAFNKEWAKWLHEGEKVL